MWLQKSIRNIRSIAGETANFTRSLSDEEKKRGSKWKELGAWSTGFYCPLSKKINDDKKEICLRISQNFWYQAEARAALDQSQAANYGVFANFVVIGKFMNHWSPLQWGVFIVNPRFWKSHLQVVLLLLPLWCGTSCRPCQPWNNPPSQEIYYHHVSPE